MSRKVVEAVIKRFLETPTAQVIAITGSWGVGKTTALHEILETYRGECAVGRYAYTSIFAAQSIGEIRTSLLTRRRPFPVMAQPDLARAPWTQRWRRWTRTRSEKISAKADFRQTYDSLREAVPFGGKHLLLAAETLAGSLVSKMLVVLDDVERIGEKVSMESLLGLVAELRDQRHCKVILVFDEGGFRKPDDLALYERYAEKVIDLKLAFQLSVEEAVDLGLSRDLPLREQVAKACTSLELRNLRVLGRVERAVRMIFPLISDLSSSVHEQLAVSIPVFACSLYERGRGFPGLPTMLTFNTFQRAVVETMEGATDLRDETWAELVERTGFQNVDDFDIAIANAMECGYIDGSPLRKHAEALHKIADRAKKQQRFSDAWSLFRDQLGSSENEVAAALVASVTEAAEVIGPLELDATVRLLRELGFDSYADTIIDEYVERRQSTPRIFDLDRHSRVGNVEDSVLRERFQIAYARSDAALKLGDAAKLVIANEQWDDGIVPAFLAATPDQLIALFEQHQGSHLRNLISGILRLPAQETDLQLLRTNVMEALQILAGRSHLNRVRIRHWGYLATTEQGDGAHEQ